MESIPLIIEEAGAEEAGGWAAWSLLSLQGRVQIMKTCNVSVEIPHQTHTLYNLTVVNKSAYLNMGYCCIRDLYDLILVATISS